jgi:glucokinase
VSMPETIGIDVGGTKTSAVRVTAAGQVVARRLRPTSYGSGEDLVAVLADLAGELTSEKVAAVGVALPGSVETASGALAFAPRPRLLDVPVRDWLHAALGLPVWTENDANAAAWAEYRCGAACGHEHVLLLAMGTGLGCGVVSDGRLLRGARGFAVEVWHLAIRPNGTGRFGDVASGTAITRLGREAAEADPGSVLAQLVEGRPQRVTGELVTKAARAGDEPARAILARTGDALGAGIAELVHVFDPSVVVVGGGPADAADLLLEPARAAYDRSQPACAKRSSAEIVSAQLGNDAAAMGAALLAAEIL